MNRTFVKAGAAAAIVAGLMGGVVAAPAVYAEPVVASSSLTDVEVSAESKAIAPEVKAMMEKCVAARPSVSYDSWRKWQLDMVIMMAHRDYRLVTENVAYFEGGNTSQDTAAAMIKDADKRLAGDLKNLQDRYARLQPGVNFMTFLDPYTGTNGIPPIQNPLGTNDRMKVQLVSSPNGSQPIKSGKPFYYCVDGNANTSTIIGRENGGPVYAQFDLKDKNDGKNEHTLNSFELTREAGKTYAQTALVVCKDESFAPEKSKVVYYSSDNGQDVFNLGVTPSDKYYVENGAHELFGEGEIATGRYVRLYLNGTTDKVGGENVLTEIVMRGTEAPNKDDVTALYDTTQLKAAIADAEALLKDHAGDYTEESVKKFSDEIAAGKALLASIEAGTATEPLSAPADRASLINKAKNDLVKQFTVTFDDKIDSTADATVKVADGATAVLPAAPVHPKGYEFAGWFLEKDGKTPFTAESVVSGDMTVYAKWTSKMGVVEEHKETIPAMPLKPADKHEVPAMKLEPAKKQENKLPQTGDLSMIAAGTAAVASAAAFVASRRHR